MNESYNRYKGDVFDLTTLNTCACLLHWMDERKEFDNVIFQPGKGQGNLKQLWGKRIREIIDESKQEYKSLRHRKGTLERCWELLLNDLRVEE